MPGKIEAAANIFEKYFCHAAFLIVLSYTLIALVVPFCLDNSLLNYDMAGTYASSWYTAEYLFPLPIGWNPFFFSGFSQNQFYGPLFPYLVAIPSQVMPVETAFKLVFSLMLLATPLAFYYFARSFGFTRNNSAAIMLLMYGLLFAFPGKYIGGNIHSTFGNGFIANALGMVLLFLYFGSLNRGISGGKIILPSILLALVGLTHTLTALAALVIPLAFIVSKPSKEKAAVIAKHIGLAFLLTAFWAVPAIVNMRFASVYQIGNIESNLLLFGIAIAIMAIGFFAKKKESMPLYTFTALLLGLSFVADEVFSLPVHYYRFTMLIYLMAPAIIFSFIQKERKILLLGALAACAFLMLTATDMRIGGTTAMQIEKLPQNLEGRVLIEAPMAKEGSPHELQYAIPMQSNVHGARGLYVESSLNSRYIFDIEQALDPGNVEWGVITDSAAIKTRPEEAKELVPYQLALFNINYVVSSQKHFSEWQEMMKVSEYNTREREMHGFGPYEYTLYRTGKSRLIEVLPFVPEMAGNGAWEEKVAAWFTSERVKDSILVHENIPEARGSVDEKVEIIEMNQRQDRIKFRVDSKEPVPVLVKISYFPNWKAYSNGKEMHIYEASPHLMLIYASGEVEMKYENTPADWAGIFMTAAGIILILPIKANYPKKMGSGLKTSKKQPGS
ncbi:Uncharacterised protein [uncultured archaeon]|nr:Uncharacterised protein [uncultured archaeon]